MARHFIITFGNSTGHIVNIIGQANKNETIEGFLRTRAKDRLQESTGSIVSYVPLAGQEFETKDVAKAWKPTTATEQDLANYLKSKNWIVYKKPITRKNAFTEKKKK